MTRSQKNSIRRMRICAAGANCFEVDMLDAQLQTLLNGLGAGATQYFSALQAKKDAGQTLSTYEAKMLKLYNQAMEIQDEAIDSATNSVVGEFVTEHWFELLAGLIAFYFLMRKFFK